MFGNRYQSKNKTRQPIVFTMESFVESAQVVTLDPIHKSQCWLGETSRIYNFRKRISFENKHKRHPHTHHKFGGGNGFLKRHKHITRTTTGNIHTCWKEGEEMLPVVCSKLQLTPVHPQHVAIIIISWCPARWLGA